MLFKSQEQGYAQKHFDSLSDRDISRQFANKETFYQPPTGFLGRTWSLASMHQKMDSLEKFYPRQANVTQAREAFAE